MPDSLTAPVHRLLASGHSVNQAIQELKRLGFTAAQAANAIHRATTLPLSEAARRVERQWTEPGPAC